jgi:hypothetical protein
LEVTKRKRNGFQNQMVPERNKEVEKNWQPWRQLMAQDKKALKFVEPFLRLIP